MRQGRSSRLNSNVTYCDNQMLLIQQIIAEAGHRGADSASGENMIYPMKQSRKVDPQDPV